jgi:hypothetical protein
MAIFSVGGTTYGMAEETLGFYAIILPVIIALGYDRLVGVGIIMVGAGVGTLASTVNPFATGVASDAAGVALGDGIGLRLIMYVVFAILAVLYVLWYARRVKADPARSMLPAAEEDQAPASAPAGPPQAMTGRQKTVLWIFGLTFGLMIFSVIPWGDFSSSLESITLGWYFPELAALFLVGAVLVGLVGGLGEEGTVTGIIAGAGDFIGAALIIAVARGVPAPATRPSRCPGPPTPPSSSNGSTPPPPPATAPRCAFTWARPKPPAACTRRPPGSPTTPSWPTSRPPSTRRAARRQPADRRHASLGTTVRAPNRVEDQTRSRSRAPAATQASQARPGRSHGIAQAPDGEPVCP